jgi:hypothetical protein
MNVSELLFELRHNILHDRSNQVSGDGNDRLWSDATLVRYIDEAQRRLARLSFIMVDHRNEETCILQTVAGQAEYDLHPAVLAVVTARLDGENGDLLRVGQASVGGYQLPGVQPSMGQNVPGLPEGPALAFQTDGGLAEDDYGSLSVVNMRIFPTPAETQTIRLRVIREPIYRLSTDDLEAIPEVPEHHHLEMLDWAAYLALRIVDVDAGSPNRAKDFQRSFASTVALARRVSMKKLHAPHRPGFGERGWSWER